MVKKILTLEKVKKIMQQILDMEIKVSVCRNRRNKEIYLGKVENLYDNVFTLKTADNKIKTFSYNEIMCGYVKIFDLRKN